MLSLSPSPPELEGFRGDPADLMIVTSARAAGGVLITKDAKIDAWSQSNTGLSITW